MSDFQKGFALGVATLALPLVIGCGLAWLNAKLEQARLPERIRNAGL